MRRALADVWPRPCNACGDLGWEQDPRKPGRLCNPCWSEIVEGKVIDTGSVHFAGGRSERAIGADLRYHGQRRDL